MLCLVWVEVCNGLHAIEMCGLCVLEALGARNDPCMLGVHNDHLESADCHKLQELG